MIQWPFGRFNGTVARSTVRSNDFIMPRRQHFGFTLIELPVARKCKRNAFTLIELLVVVANIALLVAILCCRP